jgi:hypothetical protein
MSEGFWRRHRREIFAAVITAGVVANRWWIEGPSFQGNVGSATMKGYEAACDLIVLLEASEADTRNEPDILSPELLAKVSKGPWTMRPCGQNMESIFAEVEPGIFAAVLTDDTDEETGDSGAAIGTEAKQANWELACLAPQLVEEIQKLRRHREVSR